jgi:2-hydroxychromene-2-carboxylate isomerase
MALLKFLFDYGSPTTYLAWKRLPGLLARTGARLEAVPILLGAVFKATGHASPAMVAAKGRWMFEDMQLWAARDGTKLVVNPHFPVNTTPMMRGSGDRLAPLVAAFIRQRFPEAYAKKDPDGILDPDAIAEAYWQLHVQPRSAWTQEFDLRPWIETW